MWLIKHNVNLGRAVFWNVKQSLPSLWWLSNGKTQLSACILKITLNCYSPCADSRSTYHPRSGQWAENSSHWKMQFGTSQISRQKNTPHKLSFTCQTKVCSLVTNLSFVIVRLCSLQASSNSIIASNKCWWVPVQQLFPRSSICPY